MVEMTAPNGVKVRYEHVEYGSHYLHIGENEWNKWTISSVHYEALRSFMQYERDSLLGIWRSIENPDFIVYKMLDGAVRINHETNGKSVFFSDPIDPYIHKNTIFSKVLEEWREANIKPQTWHTPLNNDIWVIKIKGILREPEAYQYSGGFYHPVNSPGRFSIEPTSEIITYAEKIFPVMP